MATLLPSGATYSDAAPRSAEEVSRLFPMNVMGKPLPDAFAAAMAIREAVMLHHPENMEELAAAIGVTEGQLVAAVWALERLHNISDVSETALHSKMDAIRDYNDRFDIKGKKKATEEALEKWKADRDKAKEASPAIKFTLPVDVRNLEDPSGIASQLEDLISQSKAVHWSDLADQLGVADLNGLLVLCSTLHLQHGYDKLSHRSMTSFFQHWASLATP